MLKNIIYKITYIYNIHLVHDAGLNLVYIYSPRTLATSNERK